MKKLIFSILMLATLHTYAQNATDTKIEILKASADAVTASYNMSADILEDALKKRLEDAKLGSGDKSKGFRVYKGVVFSEFSTEKLDIYTKVDGKKDNSSVTIAVSKGYNNFINNASDEKTVQNVKTFLNNLYMDAVKYKNGKDIEAQEEVVKKADKEYNKNIDNGKDLENEIEKLKKKLEENKSDTENAKANLEKQKGILEELKTQLKSLK